MSGKIGRFGNEKDALGANSFVGTNRERIEFGWTEFSMTSEPVPIDDQSLRMLTDELALLVLAEVSPDELLLYDETAQEFYANPAETLRTQGRDEALGFGLDAAMIAPAVILIAQTVLQWLATTAVEAAIKESTPTVMSYLRQLFRGDRREDSSGEQTGLTPEQVRHVRTIAHSKALAAGISSEQADLIADATAGALLEAE